MRYLEGTEEPGGSDEIDAARDALAPRLDSTSLQTQMLVDRSGTLRETVSNLLDEKSATIDEVTDNLK